MDAYWEKRIENIRDNVKIRDVVDHFNVYCQSAGEETQLHCPFHGDDAHASARIYSSGTMYCWVCSKVWDVISFVKDIKDIEFSEACRYLEELYGLAEIDKSIAYSPNESLESYFKKALEGTTITKDFEKDFEKINNYLISNRESFSLDRYTRLFNQYDNIYASYKTNVFKNTFDIEKSLNSLTMDMKNIV